MNLDPLRLRAASLWAEAQYAHSIKQWDTAHQRYAQALALYDETKHITSAYTALLRLCEVTRQLENWSEMVEYAKRLLKFDQGSFFIGRGQSARAWFLIGQAERQQRHIEAARQALVESVRLTARWIEDGFLEIEAQDEDERSYVQTRLEAHVALLHADALHEWGLLEAEAGNAQGAEGLIALGRLTRDQMIDSV
jgi:hypothetical protein